MNHQKIQKYIVVFFILLTSLFSQGELKSLEAQIKRERVRIDSLETHLNILLPNLLQALKAADSLTKSMVASNIALMNRINKNENKIQLLEDNAGSTDSTNFEILAKLVMIENKIVHNMKNYLYPRKEVCLLAVFFPIYPKENNILNYFRIYIFCIFCKK